MYDTDDPLDESEDLGQHNQDLEEAGHGDQVDSAAGTGHRWGCRDFTDGWDAVRTSSDVATAASTSAGMGMYSCDMPRLCMWCVLRSGLVRHRMPTCTSGWRAGSGWGQAAASSDDFAD